MTVYVGAFAASFALLATTLWLGWELRRRWRSEIELKRTQKSLHQDEQRLKAIIATQQRIGAAVLDPEKIMHAVVDDTLGLVDATGAVVELVEGETMVYRAASGTTAPHIGLRLSIQGSFSGLCILKGEPLICDDSEIDPRVNRAACRSVGARAMIVAPLLYGGKPIGVLKAVAPQPRAFTGRDAEALRLITGLLASSMARAEEFAAKQRAEALAQDASRLKSAFLANMSHEIRTPLNGILGMAALVGATSLDVTQRDYLESIEHSAAALLAIVNDILDFSKIEAGKLDLEQADFDLDHVLSDLGKVTSLAARAKGLTFSAAAPAGLSTRFVGDAGRLRQVLGNLLTNAVKFTSAGGVRLEITVVTETDRATTLRFAVVDTGIGIAPDAVTKLFAPFTQADASTTRRFGGTGLGLSISKQLVAMMGGEIGIASEAGKGSTFWFIVPLPKSRTRAKPAALSFAVGSHPALTGRRVLVAEDNLINQKIATALLARFGCQSVTATNGHEVLAALRERPFDLVLMDCQMPAMDGYEATRVIREAAGAAWQQIPIVAMTANAVKGDRERCLATGMNDYVTKPVDPALLMEAMVRVLGGGAAEVPVVDGGLIAGWRSVATGANAALIADLIGSFIEGTPERLEVLKAALAEGDRPRLGREAHSLKGAAGSLGVARLAGVLQQLEDEAETAAFPRLAELIAEAQRQFAAARAELTQLA